MSVTTCLMAILWFKYDLRTLEDFSDDVNFFMVSIADDEIIASIIRVMLIMPLSISLVIASHLAHLEERINAENPTSSAMFFDYNLKQ